MFPRQITDHPSINHPPYFPESAFTPAGDAIVYTSHRTGSSQLGTVGFPTGEDKQLTRAKAVHPYSAAKIGGRHGLLRSRGNRSQWRLIPLERTVIHPQFHPLEPTWIEFAGDPAPRMHRVRRDGTGLECLYEHGYEHGYGHGNDEFVVHETFPGHAGDLVFTVWPGQLRRINWASRAIKTISEFNPWHITPNRAGTQILCDTNHPDTGLWTIDTAADTAYGPRYTHPHPVFSRDEQHITFTGDRTGFPQIYAVPA